MRFTLPDQKLFKSYEMQPSEDYDSSLALFFDDIFTGSTKQLREIMSKQTEENETQDLSFYFCHPEADCNLVVTEDRLKTYPKDKGVLDESADLFLVRGDYPRATALLRLAMESPPGFWLLAHQAGARAGAGRQFFRSQEGVFGGGHRDRSGG